MARKNLEDELWSDMRFHLLIRKLGDEEKALGRVMRLWTVGQKYWRDGRKLIPLKVFEMGGFDHMIDVDLAEIREEGVYVKGAEKHWDWIIHLHDTRVEAGKKSAAARKQKFGSAIPKNAPYNEPKEIEQPSNTCSTPVRKDRTNSNALALALTPVPTLAPSPALTDLTHTSVVLKRARESLPFSADKKLTLMGTRAVTRVIKALHTHGRDDEMAYGDLGPKLWMILGEKYPGNTWGNIHALYTEAVARKNTSFFENDLRKLFEAHIPFISNAGSEPA